MPRHVITQMPVLAPYDKADMDSEASIQLLLLSIDQAWTIDVTTTFDQELSHNLMHRATGRNRAIGYQRPSASLPVCGIIAPTDACQAPLGGALPAALWHNSVGISSTPRLVIGPHLEKP
jgi:hypothetical protein